MKKEAMQHWVKALRSGLYTQGQRWLLNADGDFCCLGVACHMIGQIPRKDNDTGSFYFGKKSCYELPSNTTRILGMYSDIGERRDGKSLQIADKSYDSLTNANDSGCTFEQIADYIELNWKAL